MIDNIDRNNLNRDYIKYNKNLKTDLIFELTSRGFYSEILVLYSAILHCAILKRRIIISDNEFNGLKWSDIFESPIPRIDNIGILNPEAIHIEKTKDPWFKRIRKDIYNWSELSPRIIINIPEIGIYGNVFDACRVLARALFWPNAEIIKEYRDMKERLRVSAGTYAAFHIRRGDKIQQNEGDDIDPLLYLEKIKTVNPGITEIFVLTDDYSTVEILRDSSHLTIKTLCPESQRGHFWMDFNAQSPDEKLAKIRLLIIETLIAAESSSFVGVWRSNVSRMIGLLHPSPQRCYSLDRRDTWEPG